MSEQIADAGTAGNVLSRWFGDRSVGVKLLSLIGTALLATAIVGGVGIRSVQHATDIAERPGDRLGGRGTERDDR
jgi:hypothetical protein